MTRGLIDYGAIADELTVPGPSGLDVLTAPLPNLSGEARADAIAYWDGDGGNVADPIRAELAEQERYRFAAPRGRLTADDLDRIL